MKFRWVAWLVPLAASAFAETTYTGARFTVLVPAGWQPARIPEQPDSVEITKGKAYVSLGVQNSAGVSPQDMIANYERDTASKCPGFQEVKRGNAAVAGVAGVSLVYSCTYQRDGNVLFTAASASSNGTVFYFNTAAPSAEYGADKPAFDTMEKSFRLTAGGATSGGGGNAAQMAALEKVCKTGVFTPAECAAKRAALTGAQAVPAAPAQAPAAGGGQLYRDPAGRFTVAVPAGWNAVPQGANGADGVQISHGNTWLVVTTVAGAAQPADVVNALQPQFASQYRNFTRTNGGPFQFNGRAAFAGTFQGVNPKGVAVNLLIVGVAGPAGTQFAIMNSVATSDAAALNGALQSIFQSIQFRGE